MRNRLNTLLFVTEHVIGDFIIQDFEFEFFEICGFTAVDNLTVIKLCGFSFITLLFIEVNC